MGLKTIKQLETDQGILASSKTEAYGCIFGRDTLITCLKLLRVYRRTQNPELLALVRKALVNLVKLQGREENLESGEQPGKCIHEFRPTDHERLTKFLPKPWYVYQDQAMRNYDSVDATPLLLIAVYRYAQDARDPEFINSIMGNVKSAIAWLEKYSDSNRDGFVDYQLSPKRTHGGLITQNWMDSVESVFHETEGVLVYPMAPVEVQAYTYLAYQLWSRYFADKEPTLAKRLKRSAENLKTLFNEKFITEDPDGNIYLASKLDGQGTEFRSVRSNMGHCLWASLTVADGGIDSVVENKFIPHIVKRLMMPDIFEPEAGVRTLSKLSRNFQPNSYHNGSIWPHDNGMIAEGFEIHGFKDEAEQIKKAQLNALAEFKTPIELFVYMEGNFSDYCSPQGQTACKLQAWSAAAMLDFSI